MKDTVKTNNILLITTSRSEHSSELERALNELGSNYSRFNTDSQDTTVWPQYFIDSQGLVYCTFLDTKRRKNDISDFSTVWWDEVVPCPTAFDNLLYPKWAFLETQKAMNWILSSIDAKYMNSPNQILSASNKVAQLQIASRLGLTLPNTGITSDPNQVIDLAKRPTIYKPVSRPTQETVGDERLIFTSRVYPNEINNDSISSKLSLFQNYVPKKFELRVYVIGEKCLAAEIHNQKSKKASIDWRRYDIANTPHFVHDMPEDIAERCIGLTKEFGLEYSAIDMVVTPDNEYVFLEMNPQGLWLWIEKLTGLPITDGIAEHLTNL